MVHFKQKLGMFCVVSQNYQNMNAGDPKVQHFIKNSAIEIQTNFVLI